MKVLLTVFLFLIFFFVPSAHAQENVMNVPLIGQERNLSCEAAATRMVLNYFGKNHSEQEILDSFPKHPNPNLGFRGNVDGPLFSYDDYGIYAHPVAFSLSKFGVGSQPYIGISQEFVKQKVLEGKPVIIWINGVNRGVRFLKIEGLDVKLVRGEHTVVVTGYKNGFFILNDPWRKTLGKGVRTPTQRMVKNLDSLGWYNFNRMAVIVD